MIKIFSFDTIFTCLPLQCPVCADVANPEELIPYRLFRDKVTPHYSPTISALQPRILPALHPFSQVDKFRNTTGYTKAAPALPLKPASLPDIVLPILGRDYRPPVLPSGRINRLSGKNDFTLAPPRVPR